MPLLCYNMYVIGMNNEYNYYVKTIKPLEKKYNFFSYLYSIMPLNIFKKKMHYYDLIVTMYYKTLKDYPEYAKKIGETFKKNSHKL